MHQRHAVPCEVDCGPCAFSLALDTAFEDVVGLSFVAALVVDLAKVDGFEWGVSDCRGSVVCGKEWQDRESAGTDKDLTGDKGNEELLRSEDCEDDFVGFFLLLALGASVHRVYLCLWRPTTKWSPEIVRIMKTYRNSRGLYHWLVAFSIDCPFKILAPP